jgi:RNA 2',3'-cyclic 3'-phosphodiesterase
MRLFVAVHPSPAALTELDAAVAPLRGDWPELRWTGPDRWHVTLAFLGEVAEAKLDELSVRLARAAARHQPAELWIGHGGAFPNRKRARVVIARVEGDQPALAALTALAGSVAAGARRAGAPPPDEGRRYRPQLTLARCRQPTDVSAVVGSLGGFAGSAWLAGEMQLIRSHAGPKPWYETQASWPIVRPGSGPG